jgi:hypothetical protein
MGYEVKWEEDTRCDLMRKDSRRYGTGMGLDLIFGQTLVPVSNILHIHGYPLLYRFAALRNPTQSYHLQTLQNGPVYAPGGR